MTRTPTLHDSDLKAIGAFKQVAAFGTFLYATQAGTQFAPVRLSARQLSKATGISLRHVKRHWADLTGDDGPLERLEPGIYRGRTDAWPEPSRWFHRISPAVVRQLLALGGELRRLALPTLRLALHLLRRLRGALAAGDRYVEATDRQLAKSIGSAPITVRRALAELEARGLVRLGTDGRGARTVLAFSRLGARPTEPEVVHSDDPETGPSDPSGWSSDPTATINEEPSGFRDTQTGAGSAGVLADPDAFWLAELDDEANALRYVRKCLGGKGPKARKMARWAGSAAAMAQWLRDEQPLMNTCRSSGFGLLWWAATTMGSRPGRPSSASREAAERQSGPVVVPYVAPTDSQLAEYEAEHSAHLAQLRTEADAELDLAEQSADQACSLTDPDEVDAAVRRAETAAQRFRDLAGIIEQSGAQPPQGADRSTTAEARARAGRLRPVVQATVAERQRLECESQDAARARSDEARVAALSRFRRFRRR